MCTANSPLHLDWEESQLNAITSALLVEGYNFHQQLKGTLVVAKES